MIYNKPTSKYRYIRGLPEEIYDTSQSSHIVKLINALCGDSGISSIQKKYVVGQLKNSLSTTFYNDLDTLYGMSIGFTRKEREKYSFSDQMTQNKKFECYYKDSLYRNRIYKYFVAVQLGNTYNGVKLAAEAASGFKCYIFDDNPRTGVIERGTVSIIVDFPEGTSQQEIQESEKAISRFVGRLLPPNMTININYLPQEFGDYSQYFEQNTFYDFAIHNASSEFYETKKYITSDSDEIPWAIKGEKTEVPKVADYLTQTEKISMTQMIDVCKSSSNHYGKYDVDYGLHTSEISNPLNAISQSPSVSFISSYYTDNDYINDAYLYTYARQKYFNKNLWWSSAEREEDEELIIMTDSSGDIPFNHISFSLSNKPYIARIYYIENGEWKPILDDNNNVLESYYDTFGPEQTRRLEIYTKNYETDAIKITFEKIEPCSVELGFFEIDFYIKNKNDLEFISSKEVIDVMGNVLEIDKYTYSKEFAIDDDSYSYWLSKPNNNNMAIEYLVLDLGEIKPITTIEVMPIFFGARCNIYTSIDGINWSPTNSSFTLNGLPFEIARVRTRFVKLEFYNLTPMPFIVNFKTEIESLYFSDKLVYNVLNRTVVSTSNELETLPKINDKNGNELIRLTTNVITDSSNKSINMTQYGFDTESSLSVLQAPESFIIREVNETNTSPYDVKFTELGLHNYDAKIEEIKYDIAYFAAIRDIKIYDKNMLNSITKDSVFHLWAGDVIDMA